MSGSGGTLGLFEAGVQDEYVGILDPGPRNNGRGVAMLRVAGIKVHLGILADEIAVELSGYLGKTL